MAGYLSIGGQLTQLPQGQQTVGPITIVPATVNLTALTTVFLASGPNVILIPGWAAGAIIIPDPANAVQVTFKGVAGDTGTLMSLSQPWVTTFASPAPASFVLTAASAAARATEIFIF